MNGIDRRMFVSQTAAIAAGIAVLPTAVLGREKKDDPVIRKALKFGMIGGDGSVLEKFTLARSCGFDGVEMDSPAGWDLNEVLEAKKKTGIEIPGVVLSTHWSKPFNHPDGSVRRDAGIALDKALHDCKDLGGTSVLVVPAVVNASMGYAEAYEQSRDEISKHLKTAESLGVDIAFENVWNDFLLSPIEAARYVDGFGSERVGWHFDIGNVVNYGYPAQWIEILGHRIKKLDVKEFSKQKRNDEGLWKGFGVEIGDGDCGWDDVCRALKAIGYSGWAAAEVGGGGRERLTDIAERMDRVFKPMNG
ncbi:MAG: sugar phosphate isomerase/epimerase [Phycisphaerales bacterium]|nr:sugar phosphate isomerase/epimerase [Phycisphaerales bacterium]